jgi:hypothetical protein
MASYVLVAFCHCLTISVVTISADAMVFSYSAARRPLWKRRHHFALPFSNFLQMTISAEPMAFLFSSASSVEASAFCPAFLLISQVTFWLWHFPDKWHFALV